MPPNFSRARSLSLSVRLLSFKFDYFADGVLFKIEPIGTRTNDTQRVIYMKKKKTTKKQQEPRVTNIIFKNFPYP